MGQIAGELKNRPQGALPSTTEVPRGNIKEQCQAVTLIYWKTSPTVMQDQRTQGNSHPLNAPTMSQPTQSSIHKVNQPSSSTETQEKENRERREKATQVELVFVYKDTAPGHALIDVQEEILTIRVDGQQVKFNVFNALKDPYDFQSCQMIADINEKTRSTNTSLKDEAILNDNEDGEEEEINLISDRKFEQ